MKNSNICFLLVLLISILSCGKPYPVDLGQDFTLEQDVSFSFIEEIRYPDGSSIAVSGHVVDYGVSNRYIIASEKPWDKFTENKYSYYLSDDIRAFKVYKFRQYWIIDKYKQKTYGPFTKEQYLEKKIELGVPDTLKLQFERHK